MAASVNLPPATHTAVYVWIAPVPADDASCWLQHLRYPLPPYHASKLAAFKLTHDYALRAAALALMCTALHTLTGVDVPSCLTALTYDGAGRPHLHAIAGVRWAINFSYTHSMAVCALRAGNPSALPLLGVDVERTPLHGTPASFARIFSPAEQHSISQSDDCHSERTRRWTNKEAIVKAAGTGFAYDPQRVSTLCPLWGHSSVSSTEQHLDGAQLPIYTTTAQENTVPIVPTLFWQCIKPARGYWLTVASSLPWSESSISFLRLP